MTTTTVMMMMMMMFKVLQSLQNNLVHHFHCSVDDERVMVNFC